MRRGVQCPHVHMEFVGQDLKWHSAMRRLLGLQRPRLADDGLWCWPSARIPGTECFDGDSESFGAHFACGLAGAVACEPGVGFAKAFYRRPFRAGDVELPEGGGRLTLRTARGRVSLDLWEDNDQGFGLDESRTLAIAASILGLGMR